MVSSQTGGGRKRRKKRRISPSKRQPLGKKMMGKELKTQLSKDEELADLGVYDQLENKEEYYSDPGTGKWVRIDLVLVHRINHKNNTAELVPKLPVSEKSKFVPELCRPFF